jgi:hypothetical protein
MSSPDATAASPPGPPRLDLLPLLRDRPAGAPAPPAPVLVGAIPFRIDERDARDRLAQWIGRYVGSKGSDRNPIEVVDVRAEYMPCWAFSAQVRCPWRGETQRTKRRDGEWRSESVGLDGVVDRAFEDILVPASESPAAEYFDDVSPFPMSELTACDPSELDGYDVPATTVAVKDAWDIASDRMQKVLNSELRADSGLPSQSLETWPEWSGQQYRPVLVPVFTACFHHRDQPYTAIVNGATGDVAGKRPFSAVAGIPSLLITLLVLGGVLYGLFWLVRALFRL